MEIIFLEFRGIYRHQDFGDRSESETDYSDASTLNSWVTCKVKMIGWGCLLMRGTFGESWLILLGSKNLNFCESFALANQHLVPPVTYVLSEADGQTRCSWNRAVVGILVGILTNRTSNWALAWNIAGSVHPAPGGGGGILQTGYNSGGSDGPRHTAGSLIILLSRLWLHKRKFDV